MIPQVIKLKDHTLNIYSEEDAIDPRGDDNISKMVLFTKSYNLGDDNHGYNKNNYSDFDELKEAIIKKEKPITILPVYMYDHSGITIATTPFGDQFDSGQIGWVYTTNKKIDLLGCTINEGESWKDYVARLTSYLVSDIETYDQYITGEVYRYDLVGPDGEEVDSCGGFYGSDWQTNGIKDNLPQTLFEDEENV